MTDTVSPKKRSENMRRIKSKDTKVELIVRKLIWSLGYRYRLHRKDLPGKPDIVFRGKKKVIFVHGCFWHQHDDGNCKIVRKPKSNTSYWSKKLERNIERDRFNQEKLQDLGWEFLIIWECEIKNSQFQLLTDKINEFLK